MIRSWKFTETTPFPLCSQAYTILLGHIPRPHCQVRINPAHISAMNNIILPAVELCVSTILIKACHFFYIYFRICLFNQRPTAQWQGSAGTLHRLHVPSYAHSLSITHWVSGRTFFPQPCLHSVQYVLSIFPIAFRAYCSNSVEATGRKLKHTSHCI